MVSMSGSAMFLPSEIFGARVHDGLFDDDVAGGLGDDLERVEDGNARREQRAERAREARDGDLAQDRPDDRQPSA